MRTRLAPSPTGLLHLGNARTFLINWLLARQEGGSVVLRIEDIDRSRIKKGRTQCAIDDLAWLGLQWDDGPIYQHKRVARYEKAARTLTERGLIYPCICTRSDIRAASAPHAEDESLYPGTCRDRFASIEEATASSDRAPALRFRLPAGEVRFFDRFQGEVRIDPTLAGGDFVIRSSDGLWSYQLAVAVDDAEMEITDVVRGDDLIPSTPRQWRLLEALGYAPPRYTHLPLVLAADGRRLAKRHGDTQLAQLRESGISSREVLNQLAQWIGIKPPPHFETAADLVDHFRLDRVPREPLRMN